jgi:glycosyltransferase involved in cell wall biosynthesis
MTSRDDSFPFVVQDAMASRVPVVAFDRAGGAPEALAGDCGIVVPYLSVSAMTRATLELLSDPGLRDRIGRAAEERVRSVYVFSQYVEDIMAIAENGAPASGGPSGESPQAFRP